MEFISNLSKEEYVNFWENTPNNHFMQSYEWGIAGKNNRGYEPFYVGLKDNGKVVAAALLLKKKTPFNMCYFYASRGYTIDFSNATLLKEFTNGLRKFLKEQNGIYLRLDPPLMYQEIDIDGNKIPNGKNNYEVFNNMINLGYKHTGFNKLYENNQPRYTFRTYFNKYNSFEDIMNNWSKTFTKQLKRSYTYDLNIYESKDIKQFHELLKVISEKNKFREYDYNYYQNIFDEFYQPGYIKVFDAKINPSNIIKKFTEQIEIEKNPDKKNKMIKDIEFFNSIKKDNEDIVIASLICTYSKTGAWSLYIGNDHTAEYTGTVNRLYYEFMKDAYDNHYEYADLFGVVGDPKTTFKNLGGIYEYKRKFGGDYIEFIGEFDLVNKPFMYKVLPILLNIYRFIIKKIKK